MVKEPQHPTDFIKPDPDCTKNPKNSRKRAQPGGSAPINFKPKVKEEDGKLIFFSILSPV